MNYFKNILMLGLLVGLVFTACRKDVIVDDPTPGPPPPPVVNVEGGVFGLVTDENSNPVSNALIELNGHQFQTDSIGIFFFNHIDMNEGGTLVTAEKSGYFKGSRRFYPSLGNKNYVEIKLLPKISIGSVDAATGGIRETSDGAKIDLPAGGIIDENGNTYSGEVIVFAQWLNPIAEDIDQIMPGNLEGKNTEGENVALETYGMLAVELETPAGQPLNIGNDKKAQLTFPVPAQLQGTAPTEIPLWYFDEEERIWVEEESATFNGSNYVGEVGHFSFWNCDAPFPLIEISGCFIDKDGFPIINKKVKITNQTTGNSRFGMTNEEGCFTGKVPQNEQLKLELLSECMVPFYSGIIVTQSTDLGTIQATEYEDQFFISTLRGRVVDCVGDVFDEVVLEINAGGQKSHFVVDGAGFEISVEHCVDLDSLSITAFVMTDRTLKASVPNWVVLASPIQVVGDIAVCGNDQTYLKISMNGESFTYCTFNVHQGLIVSPSEFDSTLIVTAVYNNLISQDSTYASFVLQLKEWTIGQTMTLDSTNSEDSGFLFSTLSGIFHFEERLFVQASNPNHRVTLQRIDSVGGYIVGMIEIDGEYAEGWYNNDIDLFRPVSGSTSMPVDILLEFSIPRDF